MPPRYPAIYEINTWPWLASLSRKHGRTVDLAAVPAQEWNTIARYGFHAVWLMGVWERSPASIEIARRDPVLLNDFKRALPDYRFDDCIGSAYSVRRYVVDAHLGGAAGLAAARTELARRDMRLILDFVPNHIALDNPWAVTHPEYLIQGGPEDDPTAFVHDGAQFFAFGRDPYFPPWADVLQLNAFHPALRQAAIETLRSIAQQCDGVRCDMAMLLLNEIFARTWGVRAGAVPETDYWRAVIPAVREVRPDFQFIAEAYWDTEWELQKQGFDFCYDKRLYDRLAHSDAESLRAHLGADIDYQSKLVRFIENHDEPRAAAAFSADKERAAAVVAATLPGARLFHDGQFLGRKARLPVFLGRFPDEPPDEDLCRFYSALLKTLATPLFRDGEWALCDCTGWPDNSSCRNLLAWSWTRGDDRAAVIVNFSGAAAQARIHLPWSGLRGRSWLLSDALSGAVYEREGDEMSDSGLYVALDPWRFHLLQCARTAVPAPRALAVTSPGRD